MEKASKLRWLLDREVEVETGGRVTSSRLRKDRRTTQYFPFHRIGRSVYYDLAEIDAVIETARIGGNAGVTAKRGPGRPRREAA